MYRCSKPLEGGRILMTVGLVSVLITLGQGSVIGTASGCMGGAVDNFIQCAMELISSFPQIPLWAALAGALPQNMPIIQRYFLITIILSFIGWIGLARQVRGKVIEYCSNDHVSAAPAADAGNVYIILTHMLSNVASHIIVVAAMSVSGIQPPTVR